MPFIAQKPALAGTGSAELSDRSEAFDTAEYNDIASNKQASRITSYVIDRAMVAVEVRHV